MPPMLRATLGVYSQGGFPRAELESVEFQTSDVDGHDHAGTPVIKSWMADIGEAKRK